VSAEKGGEIHPKNGEKGGEIHLEQASVARMKQSGMRGFVATIFPDSALNGNCSDHVC